MYKIETKNLKDGNNVTIGTRLILSGKISYGTDTKDLMILKDAVSNLDEIYESDTIVIDVSNLEYWDSLVLKIIFPKVEYLNAKIIKDGGVPISFIGKKDTDVYDAARERYEKTDSGVIPWHENIEDFFQKISIR